MLREWQKTLAYGYWTWQVWHKRKWSLGSRSQMVRQCMRRKKWLAVSWLIFQWSGYILDLLCSPLTLKRGHLRWFASSYKWVAATSFLSCCSSAPELRKITGESNDKEVNGTLLKRCLIFIADDYSTIRNSFLDSPRHQYEKASFFYSSFGWERHQSLFRDGEKSPALSPPLCFTL